MRVSSIELPPLPEPGAHDSLHVWIGRRDPGSEHIAREVVKISREALKLGRKAEDERLIQSTGSPSAPASRSSDQLVCEQQLIKMTGPLVSPR
jgi:hypothetical protein